MRPAVLSPVHAHGRLFAPVLLVVTMRGADGDLLEALIRRGYDVLPTPSGYAARRLSPSSFLDAIVLIEGDEGVETRRLARDLRSARPDLPIVWIRAGGRGRRFTDQGFDGPGDFMLPADASADDVDRVVRPSLPRRAA